MQLTEIEMNEIEEFLDEYNIVDIPEYNPNFFEIAGFPHYENVFSNVFGFLAEKSIIIVKALLECCNTKIDENDDRVIEVKREVLTESKNKIDIVIETKRLIIGIENKIGASLDNDTEDYYDFLHKMSNEEEKELICIILSKNKIPHIPKNYKEILHYNLASSIKKYYNVLINKLGYRYFFILNEFVENIEILHGGNYMNKEFIKIAKTGNNFEKIENIVALAMEAKKEYNRYARDILSEFNTDKKTFPIQYVYGNKKDEIDDVGHLSITAVLEGCKITEYNITFDINITFDGYLISLFERKDHINKNFWDLLAKIIPDFEKEFKIEEERAYHNKLIPFEDYDMLIQKIKSYVEYFKEYKKSEKNKI